MLNAQQAYLEALQAGKETSEVKKLNENYHEKKNRFEELKKS